MKCDKCLERMYVKMTYKLDSNLTLRAYVCKKCGSTKDTKEQPTDTKEQPTSTHIPVES